MQASLNQILGFPRGSTSRRRHGATGGLTSALVAVVPSARIFASHEMKDAAELAVGVTSAGFEFDCGRRRQLL